jgi:predicted double-glycine peptidase
MSHHKRLSICVFVLLSLFVPSWVVDADMPSAFTIQGMQRIKQLTNYCGPATLAMVLRYYGLDVTQEEIGKIIYDRSSGATNGADMLLYSRERGFAAYSWNSSIDDVKKKLAAGFPVIVLQQNSREDISGHYRILTGYDDSTSVFSVLDPYYEITSMSYTECEQLWRRMGHWALLIVPSAKDSFKEELDARNPVVHMDLSTAKFKRGEYREALEEAKLALSLEPHNYYAQSMVNKIQVAMGAGAK